MALNKNRLDRSQQESTTNRGGAILRFKNGKNIIRFFPFKHRVTESDFRLGRYGKRDEVEVGEYSEELDRMVPVHFRDGKGVNCALRDCRFCEEAAEYKDSDDKSDQKMYRLLKARKTFFLNCVNAEDLDAGMQMVGLPPTVFNAVLSYVMDPEYGEEILGCEGRDFIITKDTDALPQDMYDVKLRDEKRCESLDSSLAKDVTDLYEVSFLAPGWSSDENLKGDFTGVDKEERQERAANRKAGKTKKDDDEVVERPKSRSKAKAITQADEEDPDDEPTTPPPRSVRKRRTENDFEDEAPEAGSKKNELPWEDDLPVPPPSSRPSSRPKQRKADPEPEEELELPNWVSLGKQCGFKDDDGESIFGNVTEINVDEKTIEIETEDSYWTFKYNEALKPEKPRKKK